MENSEQEGRREIKKKRKESERRQAHNLVIALAQGWK